MKLVSEVPMNFNSINQTFVESNTEAGGNVANNSANNSSTWVKELVAADEQIEKSVMIDMNLGLDTQRILITETIQFLLKLKNE